MRSPIGKVFYDDVEPDRTSVRSPVEKCVYDDVGPDRTPQRSPVEKCTYSNLKENPLSTPIEGSGFIEQDS
ncbi:hypothetical protein H6F50_25510 [Coleofasciculus sp. FACHB-712]|uniref:hypothetical protein n=1 Tax=Coleofasciculus sp. FACHB-712 TaxID=2692789 RepID=UPI001686F803|nr:hypothetical protein [Coleofasciculus sp. FACHB-712]MBD1945669.1 hypothetical protein [Coleofasciculus sp. FACHB-712]